MIKTRRGIKSLKTIASFRGQFFFLSNFYQAPVLYQGIKYLNSEAAFQSAKTLDLEQRKRFSHLSPVEAKKLGRKIPLRPDWEEIKDKVMLAIVKDKFTRNHDLAVKLLATGDAILVEVNTWGDKYWGVCANKGLNKLGKTIMKVRTELRKQQSKWFDVHFTLSGFFKIPAENSVSAANKAHTWLKDNQAEIEGLLKTRLGIEINDALGE